MDRCDAVTTEGRCLLAVVSARDNEIMGETVTINVSKDFCLFHGITILMRARNPIGLFPPYESTDTKHPLPYWKPNE